MVGQVHLPTKDYNTLLTLLNRETKFRAIVLDCGIAGIVHYTTIDNVTYYEDFFYSHDGSLNKRYLNLDNDELHAEVYQKLALTNLYYA